MSELEIADAHVHFWNLEQNYLPWLCDEPPIEFRYGDYSALRKNYLPEDYLADVGKRRVAKTVYIETEWDPTNPVGETRWVEGLRQRTGLPTVMVAQAWLDRPDCDQVLASHATFSFVRGIRHKPRHAAVLSEPTWRAGFALISRYGFCFDLQARYECFGQAAKLAREFPETTLIVDHAGLPVDRGERGLAAWRAALRELAACPNIALKISGLGIRGRAWSVDDHRPLVLDAIEIFGAERCMFASNFPVDKLVGSFDTIWSGYERIVREFSANEQRSLFHDNAVRIYRMDESPVVRRELTST